MSCRRPRAQGAAVAALHTDAPTAAETYWPQIVGWYDELLRLARYRLAGS